MVYTGGSPSKEACNTGRYNLVTLGLFRVAEQYDFAVLPTGRQAVRTAANGVWPLVKEQIDPYWRTR